MSEQPGTTPTSREADVTPTSREADTTPTPPPPKETERPHPLTPLIRGWAVLVVIIFLAGREAVPDEHGKSNLQQVLSLGIGWLLLGVLVIVLFAGAAGFVSWYFTRYVIDDEELRVETGALAKRSRRIAFQRIQSVDIIQPLAARIFGLVELRIEAGAGDSRTVLRYLTRSQATQLRDYLLARAHGDQVTLAGSAALPQASAFTDLSAAERTLVTLSPGLLIMGLVLSTEFAVSVGILVVMVIISTVAGAPLVGLFGLLPLALTVVGLVSRRVTAQFNYTLAESGRGLRITRGLTNLSSQSLPLNRIQGVRITEPLLWRRFGWARVDVDVLGYGSHDHEDNSTDVSSILLPIARLDQVRTALSRVLPGAELDGIDLRPSPKRARAIRWFDGWTLRYGWNAAVITARRGFLDRVTDVVPHAKTQSVQISRGPLQRRLRLASVHVHTPKGPVDLIARHLDPAVARELAMTQLDRARTARRTSLTGTGEAADEPVLERFGIPGVTPLGSGGESVVYPLGDDHVLRIYRSGHESAQRMIEQLRPAYRSFAGVDLGFRTPEIIESGEIGGRTYTVDRRIAGTSLSAWLPTATGDVRRQVLDQYLQAAASMSQLPLPSRQFARLFGHDPRIFDSLGDLLEDQLRTAEQRVRDNLDRDLPAGSVQRVIAEVRQRVCEPALVHGDFYPGNVMVGATRRPDPGGDAVQTVITGVADFSPHTLAADPVMDLAGAITLMGMEQYPDVLDDQRFLHELAINRYGPYVLDLEHWLDVYRRYYAIYYADDPMVYPYSIEHLQG
ncbi:PH domain-containing protein [Microlunatus elymi]|uniref:PH domain-containing protein n=1 Tax=Microlunatus elymi TaxID=2596828 RepID=A0A516PTR0_9ACTN|nr:PH domain-containing protein [Microlunatus elymi]QDP94568.1 PH domain-containing protein [Microlunatus elymi]